jgi:hypothetical protein
MSLAIRKSLAFVPIIIVCLITACGGSVQVGGVEVGIEPTSTAIPTPTVTPTPTPTSDTYVNDEYGFTFLYRSTWDLAEEPNVVKLSQDTLTLRIGYRWATEPSVLSGRTGMPAGTPIYSAKIPFLGQVIPAHTLFFEGKDKMVFYGWPVGQEFEREELAFLIWMEDLDTDYSELDIPKELQEEAQYILESFQRIEATGRPPTPTPTPPPVPTRTPTPLPTRTPAVADSPATGVDVVGWYGSVHSLPAGSDYDDYLSVLPEGAGEVGLIGTSPAIESTIAEMRDAEPPNKYAHFWGTLRCGVEDHNGCQLQVTHMRPDGPGPMLNPDPVDGWEGTVVTDSAWAQVDDAFVLSGEYPVHYGIWSDDPTLAAQLEDYRNSGIAIRVWGQVLCGLPDANGCQIQVHRLEGDAPAGSPGAELEWASYDNEEYGFSFQYPASWALAEIPGRKLEDAAKHPPGAMPVRCADAVVLSRDRLALTIQYYRKSDEGPIAWCGGIGTEVEPVTRDKTMILGREAFRRVYGSQGAVKEVYTQYAHEDADLLLDITLRDSSETAFTAAEMATIPESVLVELDQILSSFEQTQ